ASSASEIPSDTAYGCSPWLSANRSMRPLRCVAGGCPVRIRNDTAPRPKTSRSTGSACGANSGARYTSAELAKCSPVNDVLPTVDVDRSEEHTSELQSREK